MSFQIASVHEGTAADQQLADAIEQLAGDRPESLRLPMLAGPNELMQLVGDAPAWQRLAVGIAGVFGAAFFAQLGKQAAEAVVSNRSEILRVLKSGAGAPFQLMHSAFQLATSTHRLPSLALRRGMRNTALAVTTNDPVEMVIQLTRFARVAPKLEFALTHMPVKSDQSRFDFAFEHNPDGSDRVVLNEHGQAVVPARLRSYGSSPVTSVALELLIHP